MSCRPASSPEGNLDDHQAPGNESVSLSGSPVVSEVNQGTSVFCEVAELSKRQRNIARKIAMEMETRGPFGIVDGKINGQGILRKVLPLLWELPNHRIIDFPMEIQ